MTTELPPLPETDVSWVDGRDQWGYDAYESAYSAEALQAYARTALEAQAARIAELEAALASIRDGTYVDAEGPELRAQNENVHRIARAALAK